MVINAANLPNIHTTSYAGVRIMSRIPIAILLILPMWFAGCGQGPESGFSLSGDYPEPIEDAFEQEELGAPLDWESLSETDSKFVWALLDRDVAKAKSALKDGANADLDCGYGCTALMLAAATGDQELVEAVRQGGGRETPDAAPYLEILDFAKNSEQVDYRAALSEIAKLTGQQPQPAEHPATLKIELEAEAARAFLEKHHRSLLEKGCSVVLFDHHFGIGGTPDTLLIFPTRDKFAVMACTGVNGINFGIDNHLVIRWMKRLDQDHPYVLTGCGFDFLSGEFEDKVVDADTMAQRMYNFCPDIVEQGTGSVDALAEELRQTNELYFWWD